MSTPKKIPDLDGYPSFAVLHSDIGDDFIFAFPDEYTTGGRGFAAVSYKYPGAMGQGDTTDEAIADCRLAIADLIDVLEGYGE